MKKVVLENDSILCLLLSKQKNLKKLVVHILNRNIQVAISRELLNELNSKIAKLINKKVVKKNTVKLFYTEVISQFNIIENIPQEITINSIEDSRYLNLLLKTEASIFAAYNYNNYSSLDGYRNQINVIELDNFIKNL